MSRTLLVLISLTACDQGPAAPVAHEPPPPPAADAPAAADAAAPTPTRTGHADVNGVSYYYEIFGSGQPMLLLHGGLGSMDMFDPLLPILVKGREVIEVDLQGHGRSTLGDRPFRPSDMADDMSAVLDQLGYVAVDVFGYSMGGAVALRLAIQHPEQVRKLALASAGFAQDGFYPEMLPMQAQVSAAAADSMKETPMYKTYVAVAPHPEDFPKLLDRVGEWMRTPYDWSEEVKGLKMPVLLAYGDSDMFRLEHVVAFYHLIGGGLQDAGWQREHMAQNRLAILPGVTHYEMFLVPALAEDVTAFLDGGMQAPTWAEQVDQAQVR